MNWTRKLDLSRLIGFYTLLWFTHIIMVLFFFPRTFYEDNDPIDVLVLMQEPVLPGCFLRARAIGLMRMIDRGEGDDKIIVVCTDDPEYRHYNDKGELSPHRLTEIKCFFEDYKKNEHEEVVCNEFLPAPKAIDAIQYSINQGLHYVYALKCKLLCITFILPKWAPDKWMKPVLQDWQNCKKRNCMVPLIFNEENVNWLFLFLGEILGYCSLDQLNHFCEGTDVHRTGAKNSVKCEGDVMNYCVKPGSLIILFEHITMNA